MTLDHDVGGSIPPSPAMKELPKRIDVEDTDTLIKELKLSGADVGLSDDGKELVIRTGRRLRVYRKEDGYWVYDGNATIGGLMSEFFRGYFLETSITHRILPTEKK